MAQNWTDEELRAALSAYTEMLDCEASGTRYSKTQVRKRLLRGVLRHRTAASYEFRMRNISAFLAENNHDYLPGYLPASNTGANVKQRIGKLLAELELDFTVKRPAMVFFNIGWMKKYEGTAADDPTLGRHKYLEGRTHGAESFNFRSVDGRVYGFRPGTKRNVDINNLGAIQAEGKIEGVLVIWMAMEPLSKKAYIVGWYENATVYRKAQSPILSPDDQGGMSIAYTAVAQASDSVLLPPINRQFWVPSNKTMDGGFGQSVIWYGGDDDFRERVWQYVRSVKAIRTHPPSTRSPSPNPPRNNDPELRRKVERAAVKHATEYFSSELGGGYDVVTVESQARGWDLEASRGNAHLLIEVKGLLGARAVCELTPNEYEKSIDENFRDRYVIYVVNNALAEYPIATIFRYQKEIGMWQTFDGRILKVVVKPGAVLTFESAA